MASKKFKKWLPWLIAAVALVLIGAIVLVAVLSSGTADFSAPDYESRQVIKGEVIDNAKEDYLLVSESEMYEPVSYTHLTLPTMAVV